jgi:hypothetical protein
MLLVVFFGGFAALDSRLDSRFSALSSFCISASLIAARVAKRLVSDRFLGGSAVGLRGGIFFGSLGSAARRGFSFREEVAGQSRRSPCWVLSQATVAEGHFGFSGFSGDVGVACGGCRRARSGAVSRVDPSRILPAGPVMRGGARFGGSFALRKNLRSVGENRGWRGGAGGGRTLARCVGVPARPPIGLRARRSNFAKTPVVISPVYRGSIGGKCWRDRRWCQTLGFSRALALGVRTHGPAAASR